MAGYDYGERNDPRVKYPNWRADLEKEIKANINNLPALHEILSHLPNDLQGEIANKIMEMQMAVQVIPSTGIPATQHDVTHKFQALHRDPMNPKAFPDTFLGMIAMRLRVREGETLPFPFIEAASLNQHRIVVFLVCNEKPVVLEDDADMFPSDTLIGQLRTLINSQ